jgi:hypothetical protein
LNDAGTADIGKTKSEDKIMKCNEIDFIKVTEGQASEGMKNHVSECRTCREELDRFEMFIHDIMPIYREGKLRDEEIDRQLASLDRLSMKALPAEIAAKVRHLKENRLSERLKKIVSRKRENAEAWIEGILHHRMEALPASPKDITKTKKAKPKAKKRLPKKSAKKKSSGN